MATYIERATAVIDALIDDTATNAQKLKVVDAYVAEYLNRIIALGFDPETLTAEQKSRVFVTYLKKHVREIMERVDPAISDAHADYITAIEAVKTELDTEFTNEDLG